MAETISDVMRIMRLAIGRRNVNDPDATDGYLLSYINDFVTLSMPDDVKLFEQWSTLQFDAGEGDDVFDVADITGAPNFVNYTMGAYISLKAPVNQSVSWHDLEIYQDPDVFYGYWGVNNEQTLVEGMPTQMLYYDGQFVLRTVPNDTYTIYVYGYKRPNEYSANQTLDNDYWMRYLAYGAALDYARDFAYDESRMAQLEKTFKRERMLMMTRNHNQMKLQRAAPRF